MSLDTQSTIEEWFENSGDETEFVRCQRTDAFSIVGPSLMDENVGYAYSTKPTCVLPAKRLHSEYDEIGFIGKSGLPTSKDIVWIRNLLAQQQLFFIGDMDPVDLMIYAWLRAGLYPVEVNYLGLSDSYLEQLGVSLPESSVIPFAPSEQSSLTVLGKVFPDYRELVGPNCSDLLNSSRKIELEAVVSNLGPPGPLLSPLLV